MEVSGIGCQVSGWHKGVRSLFSPLRDGSKITSPPSPLPWGEGQGEGTENPEVIFDPSLSLRDVTVWPRNSPAAPAPKQPF